MLDFLLSFVIWHVNPTLIDLGFLQPRWYGLLFASGFVFGQMIFVRIFKWEGKPERDLETLLIYMIAATVLGARLGHCFFYEPDVFLADPIRILYVWEGGLASHGAAVGIIFSIWLYSRTRPDQNFWWVADRIVIVVALGGSLIRMGNLMNSEIIGKPYNGNGAFLFSYALQDYLQGKGGFQSLTVRPDASRRDTTVAGVSYAPITVQLRFDASQTQVNTVRDWTTTSLPQVIQWQNGEVSKHYSTLNKPIVPTITTESSLITATVALYGIPRHAAQLYEAISTFLLFLLLFGIYYRYKAATPEGILMGLFLTILFILRFLYEFLKENQVDFENNLSYNMGQMLSIPGVVLGLFALWHAWRSTKKK